MKPEHLSDAMSLLENELIEEAAAGWGQKKRRRSWRKWSALAACLCVVVLGAVYLLAQRDPGRPVLQWSEEFAAADYFAYNHDAAGDTTSFSDSIAFAPYADSRSFSDDRAQMEADGVIPTMPEHPLFDGWAGYNEDGSIYCVKLSWRRRDEKGLEGYSDLTITAAAQEVKQIEDVIMIEVDENGNIVPEAVTVTERDGVRIVAEGNKNRNKTLTFQNEYGWYQIAGSWNDSYEDMAYLLDWVWEHPLDFSRFAPEQGDGVENVDKGNAE